MILCACNALREAQIDDAIAAGAASADEVHHRCGAHPQCGACRDEIEDRIDDAQARWGVAAE